MGENVFKIYQKVKHIQEPIGECDLKNKNLMFDKIHPKQSESKIFAIHRSGTVI